ATETIQAINVGGNIGSSANPVSITAGDNIWTVSADNAWTSVSTGSAGELRRVETMGDFTGSIGAYFMGDGAQNGLHVAGTLDADVTFASYTAAPEHDIGTIPAGRTLSIGGGWYNPRVM